MNMYDRENNIIPYDNREYVSSRATEKRAKH